MTTIRLGLIGDNIKPSRAPYLHRAAGQLAGLDVTYDLLIPAERNMTFDALFDWARAQGMRGLNITYPYKKKAIARVGIDDPDVARLGAVNTVVFGEGRPKGYNTDHSGFVAAYRARFGGTEPGPTMVIGAGGAGSAVAFGLAALGTRALVIVDIDSGRAEGLANGLREAGVDLVEVDVSPDRAAQHVEGIVNCTPIGMAGQPGLPVDAALLGSQRWGFETIYTPLETEFLRLAAARGIDMIGGYELFIHQGLEAFHLFTGRAVDEAALRTALQSTAG